MAKVEAFHTENHEYPREVYHNQSECKYGQKIKPEHRIRGTGNKDLCSECKRLAS